MQAMVRRIAVSAGVVLSATACSASGSAAVGDPSTDTTVARAQLVRLEADAKALVRTDGCNATGLCRTAPVGAKACGGPRLYFVYCAATTDSGALFRKLDELKAAEIKFNQAANVSGTCEFRTPPGVLAEGGSCRAAP